MKMIDRWCGLRGRQVAMALNVAIMVDGSVAAADETAGPGSAVVVNVGSFRNRTGSLGCRLYKSAAGFPEASTGTVEKRLTITGDVTQSLPARTQSRSNVVLEGLRRTHSW